MITAQQIKDLRERTGAGIADVKKALEECGGDMEKAEKRISERLGGIAGKKAGRATGAGLVESYIHSDGRVGAMIELFCETDFVARNPSFKELAHDIVMHITAMRPVYQALDAVPTDIWDAEKRRFEEETRAMGKPPAITQQIVEGKLKAHFAPMALLDQPFVKDQDKTIRDVINEAIGRFGENIKIGRWARLGL
ncbi:MAG: translation elongation factor Ts [Patescibacteria group bacterium]